MVPLFEMKSVPVRQRHHNSWQMGQKQLLLAIVLAAFILCQLAIAMPDRISGSGYGLTFPIFQRYPELLRQLLGLKETLLFDITRLRLRPTVRLWRGAKIRLEYEMDFVVSPDSIPLNPFYDATFGGQLLDLRWLPVDEAKFKFFHFIDRLFFQQRFAGWRITLGRQRISWGTGRIWRPMDLFNPINPLRFDKLEREGIDALTLHAFPSPLSTIAVVYNPEQQWQYHNVAIYGQLLWREWDWAALITRHRNRWQFAASATGNLGEATLRFEALWNAATGLVQWVMGIDHQLTPSFYAAVEIFANYPPDDATPALLFGEVFSNEFYRGHWYSAVLMQYQLTPAASGSLLHLQNWSDGSGILSGEIRYDLSGQADIRAGIQVPYGDRIAEFALLPLSAFLRFSYFFTV